MKLQLERDGEVAIAIADVERGWRRLKNTFGFCDEARLEICGDEVLRVQASIRAWPNFRGCRLVRFPSAYGRIEKSWGMSELNGAILRIVVKVPRLRAARLPKSGLPGIYEAPLEIDKPDRVGFWLSVLALVAPKARDYPNVLEWDTQFFMGGRPGSSRRH
jgi:hypothetical protein